MATKTKEKVVCPECGRGIGKQGFQIHLRTHAAHGQEDDTTKRIEVARQVAGGTAASPQPGSYVGAGPSVSKTAYTMRDLERIYGMYDWDDPPESLPIIFNGVRIDVTAGQSIRLPKIFYEIYRDHLRELRDPRVARQPYDRAVGVQRLAGAGALPRVPGA